MNIKELFQNLRLARFAELPAEGIDHIYHQDAPTISTKAKQGIQSRFIYISLFIPLSLIDLTTSLGLSIFYFIESHIVFDDLKDQFLAYNQKYNALFTKNLIANISAPIGLLDPRLITFHFIRESPRSGVITSGSKLYSGNYVREETPETIEEIQEIIRRANDKGELISVAGAGLSQGEQFIPAQNGKAQIFLNLEKLNAIKIKPKQKTATIRGNVKWVELQSEANKQNLAVQVMQASNIFSIAGSLSTNIHGWNHRAGTINNTLISITLVTPQGKKLKLDKNSQYFHAVVGGFGLLGVIVKVKLQLIPNEKLIEQTEVIAVENYVNYFIKKVQSNPAIHMHLYRLSIDPSDWFTRGGFSVNYEKEANKCPTQTKNLRPEPPYGTFYHASLFNLARWFPFVRKLYSSYELNNLTTKRSVKTTNEVMQPPINAMRNPSISECEWLQEYFVSGDHLMNFLKEFKELLVKNDVALLNATIRFVKKDRLSILTYAPEDRYALVICWHQSLQATEVRKTRKWIKDSYDLVIKYNGSYYLPYQAFATNDQFYSVYPRYQEFLTIKNTLDPNEIFNTGFYQRYLRANAEDTGSYLMKIMEDETLKAKFSLFLKNILLRVDDTKCYTLLADILPYCRQSEEIYRELQDRLPEIMPSKLSLLSRDLAALANIKKELGSQLMVLLKEKGVESIDGLIEIGYPGRFIRDIKKKFMVTGQIIVIHEKQSLADIIQSGFPVPYHRFVALDFNKPDLNSINSNSADIITCYVGLHHFPNDQLDQVLGSISRILRPNGHFILVDHDADNTLDKDTMIMAHGAHTIFNVVNGVSVADENNEVRNFASIAHWKKCLAKHHLTKQEENGPPLIREGDPTRNRMVHFCNTKKYLAENSASQFFKHKRTASLPTLNMHNDCILPMRT